MADMRIPGRAIQPCLGGMGTPSNALLARYLAGECSAEELAEITRWATEDETGCGVARRGTADDS